MYCAMDVAVHGYYPTPYLPVYPIVCVHCKVYATQLESPSSLTQIASDCLCRSLCGIPCQTNGLAQRMWLDGFD